MKWFADSIYSVQPLICVCDFEYDLDVCLWGVCERGKNRRHSEGGELSPLMATWEVLFSLAPSVTVIWIAFIGAASKTAASSRGVCWEKEVRRQKFFYSPPLKVNQTGWRWRKIILCTSRDSQRCQLEISHCREEKKNEMNRLNYEKGAEFSEASNPGAFNHDGWTF